MPAPSPLVDRLLQLALDEDLGRGDVTSEAIFGEGDRLSAVFRPRQALTVSGLWVIERLIKLSGAEIDLTLSVADGDVVAAGGEIAIISGDATSVLALERSCLNFLRILGNHEDIAYCKFCLVRQHLRREHKGGGTLLAREFLKLLELHVTVFDL